MEPYWIEVSESALRQGDLLPGCFVPIFGDSFPEDGSERRLSAKELDVIVVSQSCDLEHRKLPFVALATIYDISAFERINPPFAKKGRWNEVLKGRVEGLHLLASPTVPQDNRQAVVVDFREIYSLPFDVLSQHAKNLGPRWRLKSPFLEHFSQAFARFFMRVGLPSTIPEFR